MIWLGWSSSAADPPGRRWWPSTGTAPAARPPWPGGWRPGLPRAAVLHTDLAWHQGIFTWDRLLRDDVLPVVHAGEALDYRPPAWHARSRTGSISVPGSLEFLVVEGVGASQEAIRTHYDVVIWVETDEPTRLARDLPRLADGEMSPADYASWMAEENAYVTRERPWEHADLLVYGGDSIPHDPDTQAVIAER